MAWVWGSRTLYGSSWKWPCGLTQQKTALYPFRNASLGLLQSQSGRPTWRRTISDSSDTRKRGRIPTGPGETLLFIDVNFVWLPPIPFVNPRRISKPLNRDQLGNLSPTSPLSLVQRAIPIELRPKIDQVTARYDEGGAFVKLSDGEEKATDIARQVHDYLRKNMIKPWYKPFKTARVGLVRGRPWIEDLDRFPSSRLKVEFLPTSPETSAVELSDEVLYSLARPYGRLKSIAAQPSDSKVVPRYAVLDFTAPRYAVMAKNCLHGFVVSETEGGGKSGTLLKFTYQPKIKAHWIRDWIFGHLRLVIPIVAAIIAAITVFIFDPVRTLFVRARISPPLSLDDNRIWQWIQRQVNKANGIFWFRRHKPSVTGFRAIWEDREGVIQRIQNWLIGAPDTFIVVQGPKGSGKRELVIDGVLRDNKQKLVIDCKAIQEARGDSAVIAATAAEVGYRPVFSWMNNLSTTIDTATQNAIGAKAGLSETLDTQVGNILQNTATALRQTALEKRNKNDSDAHLSDDKYLEEHPECRPVVVIDNFLHKKNGHEMINDRLAEWAAVLTTSNVARVVFLTTDPAYSKTLSRVLPSQVFHQVSLSDCTPEIAKRCVLDHIRADHETQEFKDREDEYIAELDDCIGTLGGRLTDLDTLARMVSRGERPKEAVRQIIDQSSEEILKMFLADAASESFGDLSAMSSGTARNWTVEQAWYLITRFGHSEDGTVGYGEILLADLFKKGGDDAIRDLEQTELISVTTPNDGPPVIKPGKPVYSAGFKQLIQNEFLRNRLDLRVLSRLIDMENASIAGLREELQVLASLSNQPKEVRPRIKWMASKMKASQEKIERYEKDSAALQNALRKRG